MNRVRDSRRGAPSQAAGPSRPCRGWCVQPAVRRRRPSLGHSSLRPSRPRSEALPELLGSRVALGQPLKRSGLGVKPYDARRSFANWLEQAGIWETHQQAYMGHGPRTITDLYRRHELVFEQLERDRATLLAFVAGGISGGTSEGVSRDVPVTRLGLEPRTYGLKVRCSTN